MGNAGSAAPPQPGRTSPSSPTSTRRPSTAPPRTPSKPPPHHTSPITPLPPIHPSSPSIQTLDLPPTPPNPTHPTSPPTPHPPSPPNPDDDAKSTRPSPHYDPHADVQTLQPTTATPSAGDVLLALRALPLTSPLLASLDPAPAVSADGGGVERLRLMERVDGRVLAELVQVCRAHFAVDVGEVLSEQRRMGKALDRLDVDYAEAVEGVRRKREEMAALLAEVAHRQCNTAH